MALVFRHSAEEPARCALEIAEALQKHPELPVRMGIHSGPVSEVTDVSGRTNIAGAGINMAQRVMDCGDAGHILLSQHVADDLVHSRQWASASARPRGMRGQARRPAPFGQSLRRAAGQRRGPAEISTDHAKARRRKAGAAQQCRMDRRPRARRDPRDRSGVYYFTHRTATKGAAIPEKSIAVLPMVNSTGDPANEYFSDGMSEEFISSLSRLQDLKVIGRTSSFQFKGKTDDSKTIGEKLGVYYLLEGSVRKSADRVRIAVALVKSGDGANVWSETYDRELKDIFAVQSEIAGAVAKELKVALLGNNGQTAQLATAATPSNQNVEAYNALLQGNFYFNRRTAEDYRKAIGYYEEAIRLDPRYALAYAKLSIAAVNLATSYGGLATKEREEAIAKARASAKRALELDPNLAEAHSAQGAILRTRRFQFRRRGSGIPPRPRARAAECERDGESRLPAVRHLAGSTKRSRSGSGRLRSSRYAPIPHQPRDLSHRARPLRRGRGGAAQGHRVAAAVRHELHVSGDDSDSARQTRRRRGTGETGNRSVLAHLRTGAGPLCQRRPGRGRRGPEKTDRRKRRRRRQPDRYGLCPAQGAGEDVRVAGARLDDARRRV